MDEATKENVVAGAVMLVIEELHRIVEVKGAGFQNGLSALRLAMENSGPGEVVVAPALLQSPKAEIEVFPVKKEALVEPPRLFQQRMPKHQKGTRNCFNFLVLSRIQVSRIVSTEAETIREEAVEPQEMIEGVFDSWNRSPGCFLQRSIRVLNPATNNSGSRRRSEKLHHSLDGPVQNDGVRIEQEVEAGILTRQALITGSCETHVLGIQDKVDPGEQSLRLGEVPFPRCIVDYNNLGLVEGSLSPKTFQALFETLA